jgi:hypothetical protein
MRWKVYRLPRSQFDIRVVRGAFPGSHFVSGAGARKGSSFPISVEAIFRVTSPG